MMAEFLLIVGNPNVDREYAETLNLLDLSHEDLKALYSVCDIFVLPSFEGDPIALKEALAMLAGFLRK